MSIFCILLLAYISFIFSSLLFLSSYWLWASFVIFLVPLCAKLDFFYVIFSLSLVFIVSFILCCLVWPNSCVSANCLVFTYLWFSRFLFVVDLQFHTIVIKKDGWYDFNLKVIETCFVFQYMVNPWESFTSS